MPSKTFAALAPEVAPMVPGCPQPTVINHIRRAAIAACERTLFWRYEQPKYNLQAGVFKYPYNKPAGTDVHNVFEASVNGYPLERLILEDAKNKYPAWADLFSGENPATVWAGTVSGASNVTEFNELMLAGSGEFVLPDAAVVDGSSPRSICQLTPDEYIILPLPGADEVYTIRMTYALKPSRSSSGMDEYVMDELQDVIVHAALQQLLAMPKVSWADTNVASYHAKQFLFLVTERRARANLSNMRGTLTATAPKWA